MKLKIKKGQLELDVVEGTPVEIAGLLKLLDGGDKGNQGGIAFSTERRSGRPSRIVKDEFPSIEEFAQAFKQNPDLAKLSMRKLLEALSRPQPSSDTERSRVYMRIDRAQKLLGLR